MALSKLTLLALLPFFLATPSLAASGTGKTTRYWDCCKPSCAWSDKASFKTGPVQTCDKGDNVLADVNAKSACDNGGPAFMCSDESPWAVSDSLAYGFAAVSISGGTEASWCCACYELTFTSGPVSGKKMVVQATNTGGDLGQNHFDIGMPGGGFGIFNACTPQYGTPSTGWGAQYGGISSRSQCDAFPQALKAGCYWRFDWFQNADNPSVSFKSVACPLALTNKSGCVRSDDTPTGDGAVPTASGVDAVPTASGVDAVPTDSGVDAVPTASGVDAVPTASGVDAVSSACAGTGTGATVAKWGQCGGLGWTGATVCAAGSTCMVSNEWYSQCL